MDESVVEEETELYNQYGVTHGYINRPQHYDYIDGTLRIVQALNNGPMFIEWRPTETNVDSDTQPGWAVVNTGKSRTYSNSSGCSHIEPVRIDLSKLQTFRKSTRKNRVTLKMRDDVSPSIYFRFSNKDGKDYFVNALCQYVPAIRQTKDRRLYRVIEDNEKEDYIKLRNSFGNLKLDNSGSSFSEIYNQFRSNPYEATMGAFSKITEVMLYRGWDERPTEATDLLTQSMTGENTVDLKASEASSNDYEIIPRPVEINLDDCLREQQPRRSPLTRDRWMKSFDEEGRVTDPESVKKLIFQGGISPDLRVEVWFFLLGVFPWNSTYNERVEIRAKKVQLYYVMKKQWESMTPGQEERFSDFRDRKSLIGKDAHRTDRVLPYFAGDDNPNVEKLMHILMTYVMYNFDLGYVQGMSDLLAPILELFNNEVDAFWCFAGFMDRVGSNFDMDQEGMKQQLIGVRTLIAILDPKLLNYLENNESGNMFFCFRWLLVLFKRELSRDDVMRLWEVLWSDLPCKNFQLLLCVAILSKEKQTFYDNQYGFNEILKHVNEISMHIDVNEVLGRAERIYQMLIAEADHLPDCVRILIGLPPLGLNLWVPHSVPPPGSRTEQRVSSSADSTQSSPQPPHTGAGEPGTVGRATSPTSDSERESSIEAVCNLEDSFEEGINFHYH